MSGIYGIYRYDGAPVDSSWLERMKTAMAYYGPHGGNSKIEGSVGMGHLLLEVNPEDAFENQPVRGERGPVVSAARLDNRDALLKEFGVPSTEAYRLSDGHLVSLAFDRWGEDICSHLQGDWALAGWDARDRRLLLARNACGNAPLYYYVGKGYIAFASTLKALLVLPGVVKEPDRLRLAEVLVSWSPDAERTAYKEFRCLLWGHAMSIGPTGQTRNWSHWSPLGRDRIRHPKNEDYVEAFLDHYTRAVKSCLRTQKPLSAQLSGGRDSGSMVTLAAPLLASEGRSLTAYTSVPCLPPDGAAADQIGNEWEMAHATALMIGGNLRHEPVDAADCGILKGIESYLDLGNGPGHGTGNYYWVQAVMEAASRNGAAGILIGDMGNATVSWRGNGTALFALLQNDPSTALRLLLTAEPNLWLTIKRQILKPVIIPGLLAVKRTWTSPSKSWQSYSGLNLQFAKKLDLEERMRTEGHDPEFNISPLQDLRLHLFRPVTGIATGIASQIGAKHSLCVLDPTANQELVEFLLRVPDDQFHRRGQRSWLMKRAFESLLPYPVLERIRGGLQGADIGHRILRELPAFRECLFTLDALHEVQDILDMPLLHRCLDDLVAKVDPRTTGRASQILLRGLGVGIFLRRLADNQN